jgi:hypothetical protein
LRLEAPDRDVQVGEHVVGEHAAGQVSGRQELLETSRQIRDVRRAHHGTNR